MDKKTCPDCGRDYDLGDERCVDCGTPLVLTEVLSPDEYAIIYYDAIKENVEDVEANLAAHGLEGKVRHVNLSDFRISLRSQSTWGLLVEREHATHAMETLHRIYGFTEEAEEEDLTAAFAKYGFFTLPTEELAKQPNWSPLCEAIRDPELPETLARKAADALILAAGTAEDTVLAALVGELQAEHYAVRTYSVETFVGVLAEIGTDTTIMKLLNLCADPESDIRINAVHCVGELGTIDNARALLPLLEDEDDDVRQEANGALENITGEMVTPEYIYTPTEGKRVRQEWEELLESS